MLQDSNGIPAGFARHFRKSPVTDPWEPLYSRIVDGVVILATWIRTAHCNGKGFLHGGVISSLADNAMGLSAIESLKLHGGEGSKAGLTVNLSVNCLAPAQIGQWLEVVPRVLKIGRSMAFVDALIQADSQPISGANAIFRFYDTTPAIGDKSV
jgi:uncharacterized protein (TIGR00369 family)